VVVLDERGRRALSARLLEQHFALVFPPPGRGGLGR
jgi:hypothetical protein